MTKQLNKMDSAMLKKVGWLLKFVTKSLWTYCAKQKIESALGGEGRS